MNNSIENLTLSNKKIEEFRLLYENKFNKELSFDEASELARNFINLCKVVLKDNTPLDKEKNGIKLAS